VYDVSYSGVGRKSVRTEVVAGNGTPCRKGNTGKAGAKDERGIADSRYASGDGDGTTYSCRGLNQCSFCLVVQYAAFARVIGIFGCYRYAGKAGASDERETADSRYAGGDGDAGEAGAIGERPFADSCYAGGDGDAGEAGAIGERGVADRCNACGDSDSTTYSLRDVNKTGFCLVIQYSVLACVIGVIHGYRYAGQAGAIVER